MVRKKQRCIICEAQDIDRIARHLMEYNGDMIPVCDFHYKALSKNNKK